MFPINKFSMTKFKKYSPRQSAWTLACLLLQFLVECLHEAQRKHTQEPVRILQEVAQVFQFDDVKSFLRVSLLLASE